MMTITIINTNIKRKKLIGVIMSTGMRVYMWHWHFLYDPHFFDFTYVKNSWQDLQTSDEKFHFFKLASKFHLLYKFNIKPLRSRSLMMMSGERPTVFCEDERKVCSLEKPVPLLPFMETLQFFFVSQQIILSWLRRVLTQQWGEHDTSERQRAAWR